MTNNHYDDTYEAIRQATLHSVSTDGGRMVLALLNLLRYIGEQEDRIDALTARLDNLPPTTLHPIG